MSSLIEAMYMEVLKTEEATWQFCRKANALDHALEELGAR